ncbi:MAG: MFS transporter, partial [Planctomycetes bacterium]|nr:MFS transporter [Planctomycetota bacterium]
AALAAIAVGWWADKGNPGRLLGASTLVGGASLAAHLWLASLLPLAGLRVLMGASMGAIQPALNILVLRMVPKECQGKAFGLTQSATSIGFALGPSTGGLLGAWLGFRTPFLILGAFEFLLGIFLFWRLPRNLPGPEAAAACAEASEPPGKP